MRGVISGVRAIGHRDIPCVALPRRTIMLVPRALVGLQAHPHLEDGSVYRQNRPTLFDLVTVPDGLDSVLSPFWIPASAGMTVVRRSASARMTDGDPCSSSSNGYSTRCTELRTDRSTTLEPQQTLFSWAEFMAEEPVEAKRKPKPPTASP